MLNHDFQIRVRYSDTDVMGYVHHSNYARYYETARWELFREIGIPYKELEDLGYMLPVVGMHFKFVKAAKYDDLLTIRTSLKSFDSPRISFVYKIYNLQEELINKAEVSLVFIDKKTRTICDVPEFINQAISCAKSNVI